MTTEAAAAAASGGVDWSVVVTAGTGFLGVLVGGLIQAGASYWTSEQQRKHRLLDESAERGREQAAVDAERQYVRAILARHLEAYARACAQAMWTNEDPEEDSAQSAPNFPDWPSDVSWQLLGANEMLEIRDIEVRVDMQHEQADGSIRYAASGIEEAREYLRDSAARIGLEAWRVSQKLRTKAGAQPFEFPGEGGNFAEALASRVEALDQQRREWEERRAKAAASGEADDFL